MKFIYTMLLLLCCTTSYAQTTILKGKVLDSNDTFSLPGATLRLEPGNRYTVSDVSGNFEFLSVPAGTYTLSVNYMGIKRIRNRFRSTVNKSKWKCFFLHSPRLSGKSA